MVRSVCPKLAVPLLWPVCVRYTWIYRAAHLGHWKYRPDLDNVAASAKDVLDALEDIGVLSDDNDIEVFVPAREGHPSVTGIRVLLWEG